MFRRVSLKHTTNSGKFQNAEETNIGGMDPVKGEVLLHTPGSQLKAWKVTF